MSIKSVLSGVTSSTRNPIGTGLTALERFVVGAFN